MWLTDWLLSSPKNNQKLQQNVETENRSPSNSCEDTSWPEEHERADQCVSSRLWVRNRSPQWWQTHHQHSSSPLSLGTCTRSSLHTHPPHQHWTQFIVDTTISQSQQSGRTGSSSHSTARDNSVQYKFSNFCCRMYHLATMHSITDGLFIHLPTSDHTVCSMIS